MFERPAKAPQEAKKHGYRRDTNNQQKGSTRHDRPPAYAVPCGRKQLSGQHRA
jgi:hypothetical protein